MNSYVRCPAAFRRFFIHLSIVKRFLLHLSLSGSGIYWLKMGKKSKKKSKKRVSSSTRSAGVTKTAADDIEMTCKMRLAEISALEKKMADKKLRFAIGDRVECYVQSDKDMMENMDLDLSLTELLRQMAMGEGAFEMKYKPGTVVQMWYPRNKGEVYPYQVRLDEGNALIYAREDEDNCIRKSSNAPLPVSNLFKQPPAREDCPICFIPLPLYMSRQTKYFSCCGKVICAGCVVAAQDAGVAGVNDVCPFCRAPTNISKAEFTRRTEEGIKRGDPEAMEMACLEFCENGNEEEKKRGNELLQKAANLGLCSANHRLGSAYLDLLYGVDDNFGVEKDPDKGMFHLEAAAIAGHGEARYYIGWKYCSDPSKRGLGVKHLMIGAKSGYKSCMDLIKELFVNDWVTKTEFEETLRAYQKSLDELKSVQRDKAALIYS